MPVEMTDQTQAAALSNDTTVNDAIASIVQVLRAKQASITASRPAIAEQKVTLDGILKRHERIKGRAAYYPYVGSGIGHGPLVELVDGSVKWDLISGIGVHMFGHSDAEMVETALRGAMSDTVMEGNLQFNVGSVEFGELLVREALKFSKLAHAFVINSGALANETALKVCYQKKDGKAPRVIAFADCFMGRTMAMTQIGDSAANRVGIPLNTMVDYMPFYNPDHGERSIEYARYHLQQYIDRYPGQYACFIFELVQGEGGFNVAPREFFVPLMELCKKHEIPVWIDEIQTFGRTTEMFYTSALGLGQYVDVLTLGKMSQVCAALYGEDFNPKPGLLSATFVGSAVGLKVGKRTLERLLEGNYYGPKGSIAALQAEFRARMQVLVKDRPEWFPPVPHPLGLSRAALGVYGGVGGMMRFTPFAGEKKKIIDLCHVLFEEGVIAFYCGHGPYHVRFLPPVGVMQPEQFEEVFEIVERSLERVASA